MNETETVRRDLYFELRKLLEDFGLYELQLKIDGQWRQLYSQLDDGDWMNVMDGIETLKQFWDCDAIRVLLRHNTTHTLHCLEIDSAGRKRFHLPGELRAIELEGYAPRGVELVGDETWAGDYSGDALRAGLVELQGHPYYPEVLVTADSLRPDETFGIRFCFCLRPDKVRTVVYRSDRQVLQAA